MIIMKTIINVIQEKTGTQNEAIWENVDKMHPIGKIKQGKQRRIIKFKTDTFEEVVYRKHKNRIKMTQQDQ